jgi:urease accessory protein
MRFEGHLHLRAEAGASGTVLAHQSFRAPFHVGKAYEDAGVLQLQIVNPTAGILEGDALELLAEAGEGARLCLTTPSASRAFRVANGGQATSRVRLRVEKGGWLEYAPEPLYPHAGSEFRQEVMVEAEKGAAFWYLDSVAPGRAARGELWQWRRLVMGLECRLGGIPVLRERLDASGASLGSQAAFHGFKEAWFATVILGFPAASPGGDWWEPVRALHGPGLACGVTKLSPGELWVVRLVAESSPRLREALQALRSHAADMLPGLRTRLRR